MKFILIFPDTWAKTTCLFSNSTLKLALGRASMTVPSTEIAYSFAIRLPTPSSGVWFISGLSFPVHSIGWRWCPQNGLRIYHLLSPLSSHPLKPLLHQYLY